MAGTSAVFSFLRVSIGVGLLTIAGSIFGSRFSLRWAATSRSIQGGVARLQPRELEAAIQTTSLSLLLSPSLSDSEGQRQRLFSP